MGDKNDHINLLAAIEESLATGEVLMIIYHGGSQPGATRKISPISLNGPKLRARCLSTNTAKTFLLDKITLTETNPPEEPLQYGKVQTPPTLNTLGDAYKRHADELIDLGWHVELDAGLLSLHRVRKSGKPLKGSDVDLYFEEYTCDYVWDDDNYSQEPTMENIRKRVRPYGVRGKGYRTDTFSSLTLATERFITIARALSPKHAEKNK